ncbi:S9 family peptidase [Maribellus sediminis]|uniref:S9 family peptidase n=1 Tax=Maribellus sediminis TaxID=2696285 RepID=UPI001431D0E9|nr:S9 family peptidase [Maribellus sediminis]
MKKILILLLLAVGFSLAAQESRKITLEDIFVNGTFRTYSVEGLRSMNNGIHYTTMENGTQIVKYSYETGEELEVIFDVTKVEDSPIESFVDYTFSDDETKILLTTNKKAVYRHSFTAEYYIWNSVTKELTALSVDGPQQGAMFSPNGDRVAYVRNNNIFIKNLKFGSTSQATFDGEKNKIINGLPDWVYEEEFGDFMSPTGFNTTMWWSPNSEFLAYIKFNESEVPEFSMTMYAGMTPTYDQYKLYPGEETFKYPKAGEKNSVVQVMSYELKTKMSIPVNIGEETDIYVPRLKWSPNNDLVVMRMNRLQNQLDVLFANPYTGETREAMTEKNDRYIDYNFLGAFTFLENGNFVVLSERNGWSQLYLYDKEGIEIGPITEGDFDVTAFYGFDAKKGLYYYQAAAESPLRREVYYISQDKKLKGKLSTLEGTNKADFSANFGYYVNYYSSASVPNYVTLHETKKNTQLRFLQDNTVLKNTVRLMNVPQKEFFTFKTSEGIELNGFMIKPGGFDPSKKYPVVMTQYSGPNSQQVTDSWGRGVGWNEYLAQEGFLVVCVDPRGTAARGEDFRKVTYMQLGKYESDDQVEAAKYLTTLPYVDADNMAIWGWSYGGFMTLLSMEKGGDLFKAGIAVAPVTSWRFYDSVYTERYMRTPQVNAAGYDENSPLSHAGDIKGRLLIIHGSADDNVHVQNTFEMTEKMVQAGVQFDMAIYTNRNHGIRGGNTTMHLYTKMTNFLKEQLQ